MQFREYQSAAEIIDARKRLNKVFWTPKVEVTKPTIAPEPIPEPEPIQPPPQAHERFPFKRMNVILEAVSKNTGIPVYVIKSSNRTAPVVRARQLVMYLARKENQSTLEIGRRLNGRDHSTVIHGIGRITELAPTDTNLAAQIATLKSELEILDIPNWRHG